MKPCFDDTIYCLSSKSGTSTSSYYNPSTDSGLFAYNTYYGTSAYSNYQCTQNKVLYRPQTLTFLRALFQQWIQLPVHLAKTALLALPANQIVSVSSVAAVHTYLTLQLFILWAKEQPSNHWSATKPIQMSNPNNSVCNKSRFPNGRQAKFPPTTQFSTSYMLP